MLQQSVSAAGILGVTGSPLPSSPLPFLPPWPEAAWHAAVCHSRVTTMTTPKAIVCVGPKRKSLPFPYRHTQRQTLTPARHPHPSGPAILRAWRHSCESHCCRIRMHMCTHTQACRRMLVKEAAVGSEDSDSSSGANRGSAKRHGWGEMSKRRRGFKCHYRCFTAACCSILLVTSLQQQSVGWNQHIKTRWTKAA